MAKQYTRLTITQETKNKLMVDAKAEFIKHHVNVSHININQDEMLNIVLNYYLEG